MQLELAKFPVWANSLWKLHIAIAAETMNKAAVI
jgi:hypothetical protein